jgi:ferrous iron transport protein B
MSKSIKSLNTSKQHQTVAFLGTPNSGKSTLFNELTGLQQKVGNFPGITVAPGIGEIHSQGKQIKVIDLPGTYSLTPKSPDEEFTLRALTTPTERIPKISSVLFVLDGTSLEKGLFLFAQFAQLQIPTLVVVTMIDAIKAQGAVLDDITLERALGVPVITVVGNKGLGVKEVKRALTTSESFVLPQIPDCSNDIEDEFRWARSISESVLNHHNFDTITEKIDKVLLHPVWGTVVFFAVMGLFFQSIFTWAEPLMTFIESQVSGLNYLISQSMSEGILRDFITNGIIAGVGSVVVFLPQIVILSLFVTFLEDCGYLSRSAFLVDRFMGVFGLQGRSFIPLLGSHACAIPGIMSARIIPSKKDRFITILIAPLMACSARLPVYTLLISAFIPSDTVLGFISLQALVLAGLYALGLIVGLLVALVLKKTSYFESDTLPFLIEFPMYRMPSLKSLSISVWNRAKDFLATAGTVILVLSIVLWALTEFPKSDIPAGVTAEVAQKIQLEHSFAGQLGKAIQPVFSPLGFDWKITLGIVGSFAAREVFVSVMGQIYATSIQDNESLLRDVLQHSITLPTALSVLVFYVFALQCMSTVAIIKRETGSWKWSAFAFSYTFMLAYLGGLFMYQLSSLLI